MEKILHFQQPLQKCKSTSLCWTWSKVFTLSIYSWANHAISLIIKPFSKPFRASTVALGKFGPSNVHRHIQSVFDRVRFEPLFVCAYSHAPTPPVCPVICIWSVGMERKKEKKNKKREKGIRSGSNPMWHTDRTRRASSYPPHIWAGYKGLRTAQTYEDEMRGLVGWFFFLLSLLSGQWLGCPPKHLGEFEGISCRCF